MQPISRIYKIGRVITSGNKIRVIQHTQVTTRQLKKSNLILIRRRLYLDIWNLYSRTKKLYLRIID